MIRMLVATVVLSTLASSAMASSIPDATSAYQRFPGAPEVRFAVANGYDARPITAQQYEDYRASGSCRSISHFTVWKERPDQRYAVTFVCEL